MNIRTNIFIWIFLATILPLTALALSATYYVEKTYRHDVITDIHANLENLASEIRRQHQTEQQLLLGLASSPAVTEILPVLFERRRGIAHSEINIRRSRINRFFQGFQTILTGAFFIRVLDYQGNTLVKVTTDRRSPAIYEGIEGIPLVEPELNDADFVKFLDELPKEQVAVTILPHQHRQSEQLSNVHKLDYIIPLYFRKRLVGAITLSLLNRKIDQIVEHAPRLYRSVLNVTELNPDETERNGLVIFDDMTGLRLSQPRPEKAIPTNKTAIQLLDVFENSQQGQIKLDEKNKTLFFNVVHPFNNQLISWVISSTINNEYINAPFARLRDLIWALAGLALLITLTLASFGVRQISIPLLALTKSMKSFADGKHSTRAKGASGVDEVNALEKSFNDMADTIQEVQAERDRAQRMMIQSAKLASLGEMAAGIGHELNNPLNNILSYTKLIRREIPTESTQSLRDIDSIREEAQRATEIVKGILNFARQVPPRYELFDILEWLESTLKLVTQAAREKHISLRTIFKCEPGEMLEGDRSQLQQVLVNLMLNAIHSSENNAQIVVSIRTEDGHLQISVRDEGSGIDESILDKVFDPFFSTKAEGEGSGLGLSISLGIVEHHHGKMEINNNPDHGVTAIVTLPLRPTGFSDLQKT